jgi:hypothetical protein
LRREPVSDSIFGEPIFTYSRAQALEDGVLVDVSGTAVEAGIKFPVAVTRAVWDRYVEVPEGVSCQDQAGRCWDLCWMLRCAIYANRSGSIINYELFVRNDNRRARRVELKAVCGPGDQAEPVITVLLPEED